MEKNFKPVEIKVWGDFACFTRPEMKVERVSYESPTPSAARGILEAIFRKPQFEWQVREIEILNPIQRMSILRNEVNKKSTKGKDKRYFADQDRAQRHSLILRDVSYIIRAEAVPHNGNPGEYAKYRDQFRRRVKKGQCFWRPYLGTREFSAYFCEPSGHETPEPINMGLGRMLFDFEFDKKGKGKPFFFQANIKNGVLKVPPELYEKTASSQRGGWR